jgi:hypothetical protein
MLISDQRRASIRPLYNLINNIINHYLSGVQMKTLLLVLLPLFAFAQNQLPDTLFLIDGRTTSCLITSIDEDKIFFNYGNNRSESIIIPALQRVTVESFGTVYLSGKWQIADVNKVKDFVDERLIKINDQRVVNSELRRLSLQQGDEAQVELQPSVYPPMIIPTHLKIQTYKWSFGVLYVPYYTGTIYRVIRNSSYPPDDPDIYGMVDNQVNLEAQLAYGITPELKISFDAGYTSSFSDSRFESHQRSTGYEYDQGSVSTVGLKMLDFNIGLKYYFKNIIAEQVSIYAAAGFGKQIAFAQNKYEVLFQEPTPGLITEDNIEEYTEELNSPWHFNVGFGAEYFFNESLSLTSNIRVLYSSATGKYNSRYIYQTESRTENQEKTFREFSTRIGIGLNFYF